MKNIMMFCGKDRDVFWKILRCLSGLSAASLELDFGERLFEALPRVKAGEQACDLVTAYPGNVFHTLSTEAQPEITEVAKLHDVSLCQLIRNDVEQDLYGADHIGCAKRGHIACPFGKLAYAHSARRLEGGIILLRCFAMARSAPGYRLSKGVLR
jgi:hypothetical protein